MSVEVHAAQASEISTSSEVALEAPVITRTPGRQDSTPAAPVATIAYISAAKVEARVRAYFRSTPIMAEIARCESHFHQFNSDGTVHSGTNTDGSHDLGVMQINDRTHLKTAAKLGFNIHTLEGNLGYAEWLYEQSGLAPWRSSQMCWARPSEVAFR